MATLQARALLLPTPVAVKTVRRVSVVTARLSLPKSPSATASRITLPLAPELDAIVARRIDIEREVNNRTQPSTAPSTSTGIDHMMRMVADTAADRAEMHSAIACQRAAWNSLFLGSLTSTTLFASLFSGLAATAASLSPSAALAFRVTSAALYAGATVIGAVVNYLQPSQLAEEQRNASRLFRELERDIRLSVGAAALCQREDVDLAVERVLALDKAYPLPLLGAMLEKFPAKAQPSVWWPENQYRPTSKPYVAPRRRINTQSDRERALTETAELLRTKDVPEYIKLAEKVLAINRVFAISGPLLTAIGFMGALLLGVASNSFTPWAAVAGVLSGALASLVHTMEHGGQVGMVFEMYRNCAGYYRRVEDEIAGWKATAETDRAVDWEFAELSVALQLGRSPAELRQMDEEYAGKLF